MRVIFFLILVAFSAIAEPVFWVRTQKHTGGDAIVPGDFQYFTIITMRYTWELGGMYFDLKKSRNTQTPLKVTFYDYGDFSTKLQEFTVNTTTRYEETFIETNMFMPQGHVMITFTTDSGKYYIRSLLTAMVTEDGINPVSELYALVSPTRY